MKRFLIIIVLVLVPLAGFAGLRKDSVPKETISRLINEYNSHDGFELVRIFRIAVAEYEDCDANVRDRFNEKVAKALENSELLMEVKDEEDMVRIYGTITEDGDKIKDCVIFIPEDYTLVCIFRTIPMKALMKLAGEFD